MERKHPSIKLETKPEKSNKTKNQLKLTADADNELSVISPLKLSTSKQKEMDDALVSMVLIDMLPFSCVEKEGFQHFVSVLRPAYGLPSRGKLTELIEAQYNERRLQLMSFCRNQGKYVSYTTDLWKSAAKDYYISVALHFIDDDWKLHSPLLATKQLTGLVVHYLFIFII